MSKVTRRDFLKASASLFGTACCAQATGLLRPGLVQAETRTGAPNIIIFCALDGGCDYINCWDIPHGTANYYTVRPTIAIPNGNVLDTVNNVRGFHPSLPNIHAMFNLGEVAVISRAGTYQPTGSHNNEQLKYSLGNSGSTFENSGWIGRLFDKVVESGGSITPYNTITLRMGTPEDTYCTRALKRPINMDTVANYTLSGMSGVDYAYSGTQENHFRREIHKDILALGAAGAMPTSSKQAMEGVYNTLTTVAAANTNWNNTGGPNQATFGFGSPGVQFRDACILAQANIDGILGTTGTQIFLCSQGGHDTHSDQGGVAGNQANLMASINQAVNAFKNRAVARGFWNRVVMVFYSEFGRNVRANSSNGGTDHGHAGAIVVVGGAINGGNVFGNPISNSEFSASSNVVPVQYRFESVFRELVGEHLGLPTTGIWADTPDYGFNLI